MTPLNTVEKTSIFNNNISIHICFEMKACNQIPLPLFYNK